jgi:hypothetical protein
MEKVKLINLIAAIVGFASVAVPALGYYRDYGGGDINSWAYFMSGLFVDADGDFEYLLGHPDPEDLGGLSLTVIAMVAIIAGSAILLLTVIPKVKVDPLLFTMLGWIITLAGCGVFIVFGSVVDIDGPLFAWHGIYPVGIIASFGSGGLGLYSWIMQKFPR